MRLSQLIWEWRHRGYLYGACLLTALTLGFTFQPKSQARPVRTYCALAIPPVQVVKAAQLEAVMCKGIADGQCQADFGWIVLSGPVQCD